MDERTRRNLVDAGCSEDTLRQYEQASTVGEREAILQRHRRELLDGIHVEQRKLDCLDYLIYQISNK